MKLVLFPPVRADWLAEIAAAAPDLEVINAATREEAIESIREADAFYGAITPEMLAAASRLRWVQAPRIGLEHYMFPVLLSPQVAITAQSRWHWQAGRTPSRDQASAGLRN